MVKFTFKEGNIESIYEADGVKELMELYQEINKDDELIIIKMNPLKPEEISIVLDINAGNFIGKSADCIKKQRS